MIYHVIVVFLWLDGIIDDWKNVIIHERAAKKHALNEVEGVMCELHKASLSRYNPSFASA